MGYSRKEREPKWFPTDVITITSETGVGSTALFTELKEKFHEDPRKQFVSAGEIFRRFGKEKGIEDVNVFSKYVTDHPEEKYDERLDAEMLFRGKRNHTFLEGRVVHLIPGAFRVLLTCSVWVRAERRHKEYPDLTIQEVAELIMARDRTNKERYDRLYPGWEWEESDYDLVVPTDAGHSLPGEVRLIYNAHEEWLTKMTLAGKIIHCT